MADSVAGVKSSSGWGWVLAAGIAMLFAGMFMLVYPPAASLAVTMVLGWMMIAVGVIGFIGAIMNRAEGGLWTGMLLGVLMAVAGGLIAFNVLAGTVTLTLLFTIWLLVDGIVGSVMSIVRRGSGWGWWLTSSLLSLVLGLMLLSAWPAATLWLIGVYAGIMFLFRGMMMIVLAFEVKRIGA